MIGVTPLDHHASGTDQNALRNRGSPTDGRLVSPSAERNKGPIAEILMRVLPAQGEVLEVSSGTGQHVHHFAQAMPHIRWRPTERDPNSLKSIASWLGQPPPPNVKAPLRLDVHDAVWPAHDVAAVVCINMIHIAPPSAVEALMRGAGDVLAPAADCFSTAPIVGKDGTPHPATKPSTSGSRLGIRMGRPQLGRRRPSREHHGPRAGADPGHAREQPCCRLPQALTPPPYFGCVKRRKAAGSIDDRLTLVIPQVAADLAAKHPVGPAGVHEDDRQQEQRAHQQKGLRRFQRTPPPTG